MVLSFRSQELHHGISKRISSMLTKLPKLTEIADDGEEYEEEVGGEVKTLGGTAVMLFAA